MSAIAWDAANFDPRAVLSKLFLLLGRVVPLLVLDIRFSERVAPRGSRQGGVL